MNNKFSAPSNDNIVLIAVSEFFCQDYCCFACVCVVVVVVIVVVVVVVVVVLVLVLVLVVLVLVVLVLVVFVSIQFHFIQFNNCCCFCCCCWCWWLWWWWWWWWCFVVVVVGFFTYIFFPLMADNAFNQLFSGFLSQQYTRSCDVALTPTLCSLNLPPSAARC